MYLQMTAQIQPVAFAFARMRAYPSAHSGERRRLPDQFPRFSVFTLAGQPEESGHIVPGRTFEIAGGSVIGVNRFGIAPASGIVDRHRPGGNRHRREVFPSANVCSFVFSHYSVIEFMIGLLDFLPLVILNTGFGVTLHSLAIKAIMAIADSQCIKY